MSSKLKAFSLAALAVALFCCAAPAPAQISVGVGIGVAPVCPYGYFDYPPYDCAPYGYYGPDWFDDGIFIGAGPWFHGPARFLRTRRQPLRSSSRLSRTSPGTRR